MTVEREKRKRKGQNIDPTSPPIFSIVYRKYAASSVPLDEYDVLFI